MSPFLTLRFFFILLLGMAFSTGLSAQENGVTDQYADIEEYPRFPGCDDASKSVEELEECADVKLLQWIYSNLKYPDEAKAEQLQGAVTVQFTIDKSGKINAPKILKGLGKGCDEEVLRLINSMPTWRPGKNGGSAVMTEYVLSVRFKL